MPQIKRTAAKWPEAGTTGQIGTRKVAPVVEVKYVRRSSQD